MTRPSDEALIEVVLDTLGWGSVGEYDHLQRATALEVADAVLSLLAARPVEPPCDHVPATDFNGRRQAYAHDCRAILWFVHFDPESLYWCQGECKSTPASEWRPLYVRRVTG